jgi:Cu2+-exporting ATPase
VARALLPERGAVATLRALAERGLAVRAVGPEGALLALEDAMCSAAPAREADHGALAVRELQLAGADVVVLSDGADGSGAGARADVAVAIAHGALPRSVPASIVLSTAGLESLPWLVDLARATRGSGRRCIAVAAAYHVVALPVALTGAIAPLQAAALAIVATAVSLTAAARLLD